MSENTSFTLKGIRFVFISYLLAFIIGIINVTTQFLHIAYELPSYIVASFSAVYMVLAFLFLCLMIYGILLILKGKKEFDANHERSAIIAKNLLIFGIVFFFIIVLMAPYFSDMSLPPIFVYVIGFIPFWLAYVYLIKELAEKNIRILLWLSFFLIIIANLVSGWMFIVSWEQDILVQSDLDVLAQLILVIPGLLFLFCYYKTYMKIKKDIAS
jgi:hypothetical protein